MVQCSPMARYLKAGHAARIQHDAQNVEEVVEEVGTSCSLSQQTGQQFHLNTFQCDRNNSGGNPGCREPGTSRRSSMPGWRSRRKTWGAPSTRWWSSPTRSQYNERVAAIDAVEEMAQKGQHTVASLSSVSTVNTPVVTKPCERLLPPSKQLHGNRGSRILHAVRYPGGHFSLSCDHARNHQPRGVPLRGMCSVTVWPWQPLECCSWLPSLQCVQATPLWCCQVSMVTWDMWQFMP